MYRFLEPRNTLVITTQNIIKKSAKVLIVSHDEDDGMWEFLDGDMVDENNAAIVSLEEMICMDDSINELFDLPLGWVAYRENIYSEWTRAKA